MFYVRIAQRYPELFDLKYVLCRSAEKAERLRREYGVPATVSEADCEAAKPDFVVTAVSYDANFQAAVYWLEKGFAVLAETPAASRFEDLERLWEMHRNGARLMIAEQYTRYPLLAAGLRAVRQGLLGDPCMAELSLAHDYHGISLIRRMLDCGLDREQNRAAGLPDVRLRAERYEFPVLETDSRSGPVTSGRMLPRERVRVTMEFENGKVGFYDFNGVQYHTFIRARHINVQGTRGEWNDTLLRYADAEQKPVLRKLFPERMPEYAALDTPELKKLCEDWNPAVHMENWQDEYAIATLLLDMGELARSGKEGYPLAEGLEDAYLTLLFREAVSRPGETVKTEKRPWKTGKM